MISSEFATSVTLAEPDSAREATLRAVGGYEDAPDTSHLGTSISIPRSSSTSSSFTPPGQLSSSRNPPDALRRPASHRNSSQLNLPQHSPMPRRVESLREQYRPYSQPDLERRKAERPRVRSREAQVSNTGRSSPESSSNRSDLSHRSFRTGSDQAHTSRAGTNTSQQSVATNSGRAPDQVRSDASNSTSSTARGSARAASDMLSEVRARARTSIWRGPHQPPPTGPERSNAPKDGRGQRGS